MGSKSKLPEDRVILTYKYRIRDASSKKHLKRMASSINYVWNYINDLSYRNIKDWGRFLSEYEINGFLADGVAKNLGVNAKSLQEVSKQYVQSRKQFKKLKLRWRAATKRTLGWIPFKCDIRSGTKLDDDVITYYGEAFRFYKSRSIPTDAILKTGAFVQDSRDRWYVCITFSVPKTKHQRSIKPVAIDLGIKNQLALSDGTIHTRANITKQYEERLAKAQRANKKKLTRTLHAKIANSRSDWTHKITTAIVRTYNTIYIGDLATANLIQAGKGIAKGLTDASPGSIQHHLIYKAGKLGGVAKLVSERNTTRTCSICFLMTGPRGLRGLSVREWSCPCGAEHDRDINSAANILRIGSNTPLQGSPTGEEITSSYSSR